MNMEDAKQRQMFNNRGEMDLFSYDDLYEAKNIWLSSVREVAQNEGLIGTQKILSSILFRWGQLNNNDYSEPTKYVMDNFTDEKCLKASTRFWHNVSSGSSITLQLVTG